MDISPTSPPPSVHHGTRTYMYLRVWELGKWMSEDISTCCDKPKRQQNVCVNTLSMKHHSGEIVILVQNRSVVVYLEKNRKS